MTSVPTIPQLVKMKVVRRMFSQVRQISCQIFCFHVDLAVSQQLAEQAA